MLLGTDCEGDIDTEVNFTSLLAAFNGLVEKYDMAIPYFPTRTSAGVWRPGSLSSACACACTSL